MAGFAGPAGRPRRRPAAVLLPALLMTLACALAVSCAADRTSPAGFLSGLQAVETELATAPGREKVKAGVFEITKELSNIPSCSGTRAALFAALDIKPQQAYGTTRDARTP
jgi:hypothetical protein